MTIREYIENQNAEIQARVASGELSFAFTLDVDSVLDGLPAEVVTVEDYRRYELWLCHYDEFKYAHGFRPRWTNWTDHDVQGWKDELESLAEYQRWEAKMREEAELAERLEREESEARIARAKDTSIGDAFIAQHIEIPEDAHLDERWDDDEPSDGFMSDVEADADALASCGWGTDEDYGYYGDEW